MSECWKWGQAMLKAGEDELGSCEGDILKIVIVGLTFKPRGIMPERQALSVLLK